jgi:hypothetical protein
MSDTRGNQTGHELELSPDEGTEKIGDLFNPGYPDSGNEPRDGLVTTDSGQDISRAARVTLGSYLSSATKGQVGVTRPNSFQLSDGSSPATAAFDSNGSSRQSPALTRRDVEASGKTVGTYLDLAKGYEPAARSFEGTKHSEYSRSGNNPFQDSDISIKNYSEPEARARGQDGNSVLLNIRPRGAGSASELGNPNISPLPESAPILQKKISDVLRNNRFNPIERAFVQNHTLTGTGTTLQRKLGVHEKDNGKVIRQDLLEQVGLKLMIRATGHSIPGQDLLDSTNNLQDTNNFAPLIPSAPQLTGLPLIDVVNLRAGNVAVAEDILGVGVTPESARAEYINDIYPEGIDRSQDGSRDAFTGKSYGVLNSHIEPFGGPLPIGTFTTTVAGIIAIVGASALVSLLPLLLGGSTAISARQSTFNADPSTLIKGKRSFLNAEADGYSRDNLQEFVLSLLGIPKTDHNWGLCLLTGIGAFFGIEIRRPVAGQGVSIDEDSILESIFNIVTAPGYYAVVIRNAIRDTEQIVRAIEDFSGSVSGTNVVGAISGLFKIVESITTSALYRFIMSMTALGNQVLNYAVRPENDIAGYLENPDRHRSRISESSQSVETMEAVLGGDLGSKRASSLAWKHSAPYSAYVLPGTFVSALDTSPAGGRDLGKLAPSERVRSGESGNRIPKDQVHLIENKLEAEYVPFYFQDLRTNEIISFHAFLTDLSDGFAASYNSTTGYGRADEVMVYNNTKRSISFGFQVVATSVEDLDVMYWNVNKLISMLYPQYSRGRVMTSGGDKFIQPFSQIPTASPMIRLRIGDIIRGNYSKFGLARLFGLGQDESSFRFDSEDSAQRSYERRRRAALPDALRRAREELSGRQKGAGDMVTLRAISRDQPLWCNRQGQAAWLGTETVPNPPRRRRRPDMNFALNIYRPGVPSRLQESIDSGQGKNLPANTEVRIIETIDFSGLSSEATAAFLAATGPDESVAVRPRDDPQFLVEIVTSAPEVEAELAEVLGDFKYFYVLQSDVTGYSSSQVQARANEILDEEIGTAPSDRDQNTLEDFFSGAEGKNPIVRSFESTRGRGLAGFITSLNMADLIEPTWETEPGMRAPKSMKLTVSFSPIHDIPMGLDSDGMMRSVAYNVGSMSRVVGRDQYEGEPTPPATGAGQGEGNGSQ